jgi:hypothetical protein
MSWKGFGNKWSWPNLRYYPAICLEGLRKTSKTSIRIAGLQAEVSIWDLLNTKQECYSLDYDV